jgi:ribokinase
MKAPAKVRLVVLGSSNTDLVVQCPRLPRAGETIAGGEFVRHAGGKGANQAVAAARAGAHVVFIGRHGRDEFGHAAKAGLRREGIDVKHFRATDDAPSGVALILIGGRTRENMIAVARSANDCVAPEDVFAAEREFARADAVVAQLEVPLAAVMAAAELARRYAVPFILNPAPARKLPARLLRLVDTLTPNEHEAKFLTGEKRPQAAAAALLRRGCRRVVITLGAKGALILDEEGGQRIGAPRVRAADTVGAGDCFTAWLALGRAEGLDLAAATHRAARAAALAVTRPGAQAGMPTRAEVS